MVDPLEDEASPVFRLISAAELDKWTGLVAVGGDALEDNRRLYDE